MLLRQHIILLCVFSLAANAFAQDQAGQAQVPAQAGGQLTPALEQLLEHWANASSKIKRLEGTHLRRVYDSVFEVERLSEGHFYYEHPDKGRIDVTPTAITQKMIADRNAPDARVRRKQDGKPYDLVPGKPEKWVCDGIRVFEIDEDKKSAQVAQLPPNMQGASIMDSPLPFLFGMPPEKAKERFHLSFSRPFNPQAGFAYISALPRREQDAASWSKADVILDLKTFLPLAIQLADPPGTGVTVYRFSDLQVNKSKWIKPPSMWFVKIFQPDLRDYNVVAIDPGQPVKTANREDGRNNPQPAAPRQKLPPVVKNYVGQPYEDAVRDLEQMGLQKARKQILIVRGSVASRQQDVFKVQQQSPPAGTPITADTVVTLKLWLKPPQ
jgi:TIGR03009 family protein